MSTLLTRMAGPRCTMRVGRGTRRWNRYHAALAPTPRAKIGWAIGHRTISKIAGRRISGPERSRRHIHLEVGWTWTRVTKRTGNSMIDTEFSASQIVDLEV